MTTDMSKYALPAEILKEAESAATGGFDLIVPEGTVRKKDQFAEWVEYAEIQDTYMEAERTLPNGQKRTSFVLRTNIIPFGESPNGGRKNYHDFMSINYGALKGDQSACGTMDLEMEKSISQQSINRIRQLAKILGFDTSDGVSAEMLEGMFPLKDSEGESSLQGMKVAFTISDNNAAKNPKYRQKTRMYAPAPEGI